MLMLLQHRLLCIPAQTAFVLANCTSLKSGSTWLTYSLPLLASTGTISKYWKMVSKLVIWFRWTEVNITSVFFNFAITFISAVFACACDSFCHRRVFFGDLEPLVFLVTVLSSCFLATDWPANYNWVTNENSSNSAVFTLHKCHFFLTNWAVVFDRRDENIFVVSLGKEGQNPWSPLPYQVTPKAMYALLKYLIEQRIYWTNVLGIILLILWNLYSLRTRKFRRNF